MTAYSEGFYGTYELGARSSAEVIVPMILELLSPASTLDVGCGTGGWLAEFRSRGVDDVLGLEGEWLPMDRLKIPPNRFSTIDLNRPGTPTRCFDLALCLEVAEHVDEPSAKDLIEFLTTASPFVVFSAAVPGQGGTGHVNEQWLNYWECLFDSFGYDLYDPIRAVIWDDPRVEPWYSQNLVVFADRTADPHRIRKLTAGHIRNSIPVRAIHPLLRASKYN